MIKLTIPRVIGGKRKPAGAIVSLPDALEARLVQIGKAKPVKETPIYDKFKSVLDESGLADKAAILQADLTTVKGIGKATEDQIKDELSH